MNPYYPFVEKEKAKQFTRAMKKKNHTEIIIKWNWQHTIERRKEKTAAVLSNKTLRGKRFSLDFHKKTN